MSSTRQVSGCSTTCNSLQRSLPTPLSHEDCSHGKRRSNKLRKNGKVVSSLFRERQLMSICLEARFEQSVSQYYLSVRNQPCQGLFTSRWTSEASALSPRFPLMEIFISYNRISHCL